MSDAEVLRRAARHARITARLATTTRPTPWAIATENHGVGTQTTVRCADGRHVTGFLTTPVAVHIDLWSPDAAHAVAEWLDSAAHDAEQIGPDRRAVAAARALLGEDAAHDPGPDAVPTPAPGPAPPQQPARPEEVSPTNEDD